MSSTSMNKVKVQLEQMLSSYFDSIRVSTDSISVLKKITILPGDTKEKLMQTVHDSLAKCTERYVLCQKALKLLEINAEDEELIMILSFLTTEEYASEFAPTELVTIH